MYRFHSLKLFAQLFCPKIKRRPGASRPLATDRSNKALKDLRVTSPLLFGGKVFLMVALVAAFAVGATTTNNEVKTMMAALTSIAPMMIGIETMSKKCATWMERINAISVFLVWFLIAMGFLTAAVIVPTLVCQFAIGAMLAHGIELSHQALHKKGTGNYEIDTYIGLVLCGAVFMSFYRYRWTHLRHHKWNGTELDKESFEYSYDVLESASLARRLMGLFLHLTLPGHYVTAARNIWAAVHGKLKDKLLVEYPDMPKLRAYEIQREYQCQFAVLVLAALISIAFQSTMLLNLWIIPVLLGWGPAHSLIETTEHWHCDVPNPNVFQNTRSLKAGFFARWYTNFNNCHVGHHYDMSVPAQNLPALEARIMQTNEIVHLEESYPAFYVRFFKHVWRGNSNS